MPGTMLSLGLSSTLPQHGGDSTSLRCWSSHWCQADLWHATNSIGLVSAWPDSLPVPSSGVIFQAMGVLTV